MLTPSKAYLSQRDIDQRNAVPARPIARGRHAGEPRSNRFAIRRYVHAFAEAYLENIRVVDGILKVQN